MNKQREWFLSLKPSERGRYLYPRIRDGFRQDVDPHTGLLAGPKYMHYSVMGYPVCREVFLQVYPVSDRTLKDMVHKAKAGHFHFYQRHTCGERLRRPVPTHTAERGGQRHTSVPTHSPPHCTPLRASRTVHRCTLPISATHAVLPSRAHWLRSVPHPTRCALGCSPPLHRLRRWCTEGVAQ